MLSYLCDGKVQADIDDNSEEEDVEGSYDQERLLQHQDLIEVIMNLVNKKKISLLIQVWIQFHIKFTQLWSKSSEVPPS